MGVSEQGGRGMGGRTVCARARTYEHVTAGGCACVCMCVRVHACSMCACVRLCVRTCLWLRSGTFTRIYVHAIARMHPLPDLLSCMLLCMCATTTPALMCCAGPAVQAGAIPHPRGHARVGAEGPGNRSREQLCHRLRGAGAAQGGCHRGGHLHF